MKHVALWGAWYGSHNVGDQAMLLTITELLYNEFGGARFSVFSSNPDHVESYGSIETPFQISALQNKRQFPAIVRTLATCDLLVIGGGVPFFQRPYQLLIMSVIVGLARLFRTPYMTWAVASQEINSPLARLIFRWVGQNAAALTYRDPLTGDMFKSCGIARPMEMVGDPAFLLSSSNSDIAGLLERSGTANHGRPYAALACRQMRHDHPYSKAHHGKKSPDIIETMIESFAAALDWMWEVGYQPILIPMNTVHPDDDREMHRIIVERATHGAFALLVDEEVRPRTVPALFARCDLALVSRLHAGVLAAVGNCPFVMYSIGPKMKGIMQALDLERWVIEDHAATPSVTQNLLAQADAERSSLRAHLERKLETMRRLARRPAALAQSIVFEPLDD